MDIDSINTHATIEDSYWWFVGRRKVISYLAGRYLIGNKRKILDWGCGAGGNFKMLSQFGEVLGVDSSSEAIAFCKKRLFTNVLELQTIDQLQTDVKFDLLANFDVLEHIEDDERFLRDTHKVLKPGGFILVTVPAYMFLWSQLDEVLGHVRRYSRSELVRKFEKCGFTIIRASYFIAILSPIFILVRLLQKTIPSKNTLDDMVIRLPKPVNQFFVWLISIEAQLVRWINLPFGTSIILLARRSNY